LILLLSILYINRFIYCIEHFSSFNIFNFYKNENNIISLVIINKYFLKQLLKEKNDSFTNIIFNRYHSNYILRYLYKFKLISSKQYYLFNSFNIDDITYEFMNFFYYNENNYIFSNNITKYNYTRIATIQKFISRYGYDINMIKYCASITKKFNILISGEYTSGFKLPLNFSLKIYKKYSEKIYANNKCVIEHENKYFEKVINILVDDSFAFKANNIESFLDLTNINTIVRYGIDLNLIKQSDITMKCENGYELNHKDTVFHLKISKFKNKNKYNFPIFEVINKNKNIEKILNNPNYLFKLNIDLNIDSLESKIIYIISLIHNNYNRNLIRFLTSFIITSLYSNIIFENGKIVFYNKNVNFDDTFKEYYLKESLLKIPNKTFINYLEFKDNITKTNFDYIENR